MLSSTLILLFFTFLGTALRFDDKSVAERSTQIASNHAKAEAERQRVAEEAAKRKTESKTVAADISVPTRSGDELREEFVRRMRGKYGPDQSAPVLVLMAMTYFDEMTGSSKWRFAQDRCTKTVNEGNDNRDEKWVDDGLMWCVKDAMEACESIRGYDGFDEKSQHVVSQMKGNCVRTARFKSKHGSF